jgi:hypothetical protein
MSTLSPADLILLRATRGDVITTEDAALALFPELAFTFYCTVAASGRLALFQSREDRNAEVFDDEVAFTLELTPEQRARLIEYARLALLTQAYPRTDAQEVA